MTDADHATRAASFGAVADVYERARPTYPAAAVDWLVPGPGRVVLDLGAGTGKLTAGIADRAAETIAVEPDPAMRALLAERIPSARVLAGGAEEIPLGDGSVDAIVVGQAWHWVDPERALPEAARVLRSRGTLGLVWNRRDERAPWVARLGEAIGAGDADVLPMADVEIGPPFDALERFTVDWSAPLDLDLLLDLVRSRSYFITAGEDQKAEVIAAARAVIESEPGLDPAGFEMPYRTYCFRAARP